MIMDLSFVELYYLPRFETSPSKTFAYQYTEAGTADYICYYSTS